MGTLLFLFVLVVGSAFAWLCYMVKKTRADALTKGGYVEAGKNVVDKVRDFEDGIEEVVNHYDRPRGN